METPRNSGMPTRMTAVEWAEGIAGLERTTQPDGTFIYTFFKATARK